MVVVRHAAIGLLLAGGPTGDLAGALRVLPAEVAGPEAAAVAAAVALVRGDLQGCDKNLLRAGELVPDATSEWIDRIEFATSLVTLARAAADWRRRHAGGGSGAGRRSAPALRTPGRHGHRSSPHLRPGLRVAGGGALGAGPADVDGGGPGRVRLAGTSTSPGSPAHGSPSRRH